MTRHDRRAATASALTIALMLAACGGGGNGVSSTPVPTPTPTPTPTGDTTLPSVSITSPVSGAVFSPRTTITIQASASDNVSVSKVEFYVNGTLICSDSAASYSCAYKLPGAKDASYLIEARVYDSSNNVGSRKISISSSGAAAKGP